MEPPRYSVIPEEDHAEVLSTKWLTPQLTYKAGGHFGNLAIEEEKVTRQGTAICATACRMATINQADYKNLLEEHLRNQKAAKVAFLKKLPMLSHWPNKPLNKLVESIKE